MSYKDIDRTIEKQVKKGRRAALSSVKEPILFPFKIDKKTKDAALLKCDKMGINLSAYLRICVEKLLELPIDYHIAEMYKEIIKDATEEVTSKKRRR